MADRSEILINPLRSDDVERCAELETILFPGDSPWPASAFASEVDNRNVRFYAARDGGRLIGYAGLGLLGNTFFPESEVHTIGVAPEYQGRRIGYALLCRLLDDADEHGGAVYLEVRTDNGPARTLYERNGFVVVGTRKNYYRPSGADAYTMRRAAAGEETP
ncbi:Ribosomal-protein-alanine acetyltransferase OS=Tsukamurella paurometabola (strain ATCC 8368 / DSM / CCUG 35730 / CIP 100753 / JCM 10117 / KCTC 9821 / NBRC 16120 / NCIMB 702349 / NCTC 13040) OX=521096 GN=Tpau_0884 PE=4 SV=1 [Tsukamurella paurometabola]|uniref:Ribosomal-protein-alanine acetyltransferase n=1 Tax=Tsukamurella paurometabola (strain ATCC 8368 / DSM 20162 / CCUG 35730 / CIP 100753 / JCM 10117 / KCTC 9821 / NBRC 16120 / NCIMB 702349 / NCTC 13040) TaxID=521096 RepID=D5UUE7_TSUPD|nr:ribosomal protein S18-alanine N-acetyltransferase [Tsukamurella paurometabola]ADG77518.1 ribosomal-protein-alanine acetyltransferase [Tsukamurella paurometabola DSM 20162]SUP27534.1 ribosomal-protein-alanine N-acetyltransferase [Tsukamurella paurometabola]